MSGLERSYTALHKPAAACRTEKKGRRLRSHCHVVRAFTGLYLLASRLTALVLQPTAAAHWLKPAKNKLTCFDFHKFLQIHKISVAGDLLITFKICQIIL